jgi:ferredoxin-NADP reductase
MQYLKPITNFLDNLLNSVPMYKTVLYSLLFITSVVFVESFLGIISYDWQSLAISFFLSTFVCVVSNFIFCKIYKLPFQYESSLITALIIFLVLLPGEDFISILALVIANFLAMLSKYVLNFRHTHIFNPAAFGIFSVTFLGYIFPDLATGFWWVGSLYLLPIVLLTGFIVVHKTRKIFLFVFAAVLNFIVAIVSAYFFQVNVLEILYSTFIAGPFLFMFAFMLTEPHTMAKNRVQQLIYISVIFLLPPFFHLSHTANIPPELAILIGNFFTFFVSSRKRFVLSLSEIKKLNENTFEYVFTNLDDKKHGGKIDFTPGEYLEWLLPHKNPDFRGERRYFTISSVPGHNTIAFATKFPPKDESSFKKALREIKIGDKIYATQLGGDFVLPKSNKNNIIMVAGGIGITPFVSQLRELVCKVSSIKKDLSIALFYCANSIDDVVYKDLLTEAVEKLGLKVVYVLANNSTTTSQPTLSQNQFVETGYINKDIINKYTQNLNNEFYISGPNKMVQLVENILSQNIKGKQKIHINFFPGL